MGVLASGGSIVGAASLATLTSSGDTAILFDNVGQMAAAVTAVVMLLIAARGAASERRSICRGFLVSLICVFVGLVAWTFDPVGTSGVSVGADIWLIAGVSIGLAAFAPALFGPIERGARSGVAVDAAILFLTGMILVATVWRPDVTVLERSGALPALIAGAILIASSAAGWVGLVARRVQPGFRGPWAIIDGMLAVGISWVSWIDATAHGAAVTVALSDFLFSGGLLLIALGAVTWDDQRAPTPGYDRFARAGSTVFPILAILLVVALEIMPTPSRPLELGAVGTGIVVLLAVARQWLLNRSERRALEAERRAALRLERETRERAETIVSLSRLEPGASVEATAERICSEALRLEGIDAAVVRSFTRNREVVPLAVAGLEGDTHHPVGRPLEPTRSALVISRSGHGPWLETLDGSAADPDLAAMYGAGLRGMVNAPMRWNDALVGAIGLGTHSSAAAATLVDRLATAREFGVVAAALLGPGLVAREQTGALRETIQGVIDEQAFRPVFQAVVELATGRIVGHEALTRFSDGTRPDRRFDDAARAGLGLELERACLALAVREAARLPGGTWLSLNVSPDLATTLVPLVAVLEPADRDIVLEITEHVPIPDYGRLSTALGALRGGVRLAVDDAGAGYAGLRHILEINPQFVKLDIALVRSVDTDPARRAMISSMIAFAAETGCTLIAEGIERPEELAVLRGLGVALGQGYLLAKPEPAPPAG